MFGMQAINLFAQRGILYFVHQAPPLVTEHLHIPLRALNRQVPKSTKVICGVDFRRESGQV
jgi:hypothetical protein